MPQPFNHPSKGVIRTPPKDGHCGGLARGFCPLGATFQRQRRDAIPAQGIALGQMTANEPVGLKARSILNCMSQSLSYLLIHIVFSTKDRAQTLDASIRPALHAYLATVARNADCECYRAGGVADHVHLAIRMSRTMTVARLVDIVIEMAQDAVARIVWFCMAARIRCIFGRASRLGGVASLHRHPGRTSSHPNIPRGV
jgi:REP element-mobilizing transposase RayT